MKTGPIIAFLGMAVLLVAFAFLEIHGLRVLILQCRAESFPTTKGWISSGEVTVTRGRHTSYKPSFTYLYQVNGQSHTGQQYRYDGQPTFSKSNAAEQMVREHPVYSEIQVYYNPADPSDAVLSPGVEGFDIGIVLLAFPACLALLYWMAKFAWAVVCPEPISSKKTRGRHSQYRPLPTSLVTAGLLCLFAGAVMMSTPSAGMSDGIIVVLVIGVSGVGVFFWRYRSVSAGFDELGRKKRAARTE